jgi:hypothetical protein
MSDVESVRYWLSWIEVGSTVALLLVALGVGYEFVADRVAAPLRRKVEAARETEIANIGTQLSNARVEIAKTQERAAEAEKQTAEANLEIARLTTPRRLSPERITSILKPFTGQKFSLAVSPEPEPLTLLAELKSALLASGWTEVPATGFGDISIGDAASAIGNGVIPRFAPSATPKTQEAANALAAGLNAQGIASKVESDLRVQDPSEINVLVGVKPIWR